MRNYVPSLLAFGVALCFSTSAFAVKAEQLQQVCKRERLSQDICKRAMDVYNSDHKPDPAQFLAGAPASLADLVAKVNAVKTPVSAKAMACCSKPADCESVLKRESNGAATMYGTAKAELDAATAAQSSAGANDAHAKSLAVLVAQEKVQASVVGACLAFKEVCRESVSSYSHEASGLISTPLADGTTPDVAKKAMAPLLKASNDCMALKPTEMKEELDRIAAERGKGQAGEGETNAGTDPGTGGETDPGEETDPEQAKKEEKKNAGGMGGIDPASMMGMLQGLMQKEEETAEPETPVMDCSNEAIAGCKKAGKEDDRWKNESGIQPMSMKKGSGSPGSFNVDPMPSVNGGPQIGGGEGGAPASSAGIGGGGGTPLGQASGATLDPARAGGVAGPSGKGDILHGERGGSGYSATNAGMTLTASAGGGGYSNSSLRDAGLDPNSDLARFLPKTDGRKLAGAAGGGANPQINTSTVNIWNRISDHIKTRCNQGLLKDCAP